MLSARGLLVGERIQRGTAHQLNLSSPDILAPPIGGFQAPDDIFPAPTLSLGPIWPAPSHERPEALEADLTKADVSVPVAFGAEWEERVVDVKGAEVTDGDERKECGEGSMEGLRSADVVGD